MSGSEGVSSMKEKRFFVSKITKEQILGTCKTKIFGALFKTILLFEGQKKKRKQESNNSYPFLAGLQKVNPAYRLVNATWAIIF